MKRVVNSQYEKALLLKSRVSKSRLGLEQTHGVSISVSKIFSSLGLEFFQVLVSVSTIRVLTTSLVMH